MSKSAKKSVVLIMIVAINLIINYQFVFANDFDIYNLTTKDKAYSISNIGSDKSVASAFITDMISGKVFGIESFGKVYNFKDSVTAIKSNKVTNGGTSSSAFLNIKDSIVKPSLILDTYDITSELTDSVFKDYVYTLVGKSSPAPILYGDVKNITVVNCTNLGVTDCAGIKYFSSLTSFIAKGSTLESIDLCYNTSITYMADTALTSCAKLTSIKLPDSIKTIGLRCMAYDTSLTDVIMPKNLTTMSTGVFNGCSSLKTIDLPNSINSTGLNDFIYCSSLKNVNIPTSLTTLNSGFFNECTSLDSIFIPDSITTINNAFNGCTSLESVVIPNSVTSIVGAFSNCTSLNSVVIPNSVIDMNNAFYDCIALDSVVIPNSVTNISGAFNGCSSLPNINIPESIINMQGAFMGCTSLASVSIPNSVTMMDDAFNKCTSLTDIMVPNSVMSMYRSFYGCSSLKSAIVSNSVTNIEYTFFNCTELTNVTIPSSVIDMYETFYNCLCPLVISTQADSTYVRGYTGYPAGSTFVTIQ